MAALTHVSIGLAFKRFVPTVPLWILLSCTCLLDILFFVFFFPGIEKGDVPFWTHSLLMAAIWSVLAALVTVLASRNARTSLFIGLLVFSHWIVDFITWPAGVPLFPIEGSPQISPGLFNGIYSSQLGMIIGIIVIEFGGLILGTGIYMLTRKKAQKGERELLAQN